MSSRVEPREMDTVAVPTILRHIHESVHDCLRDGTVPAHLPPRKNAKGDVQQPADVVAVTDPDLGWVERICAVVGILRRPGDTEVTFTTLPDWVRDV